MSSFKGIAIIDGKERTLLKAEYTLYKLIDITGNPTTTTRKSPFHLMFESTGFDSDLYLYMFSPNASFSGELIFYDRDEFKILYKVEFHKAYIIDLTEEFDNQDNLPLHINLAISCGAIKIKGVKKIENWVFEDPFVEVEPTVLESDEEKEVIDFKFTAKLERPDNYKGEFGFDWMRDNYKTICKDYNKLKKEYTPTKIHDTDYFVPWLSMFPNQKGVKLKLIITEIEGVSKNTEIIKLPPQRGIKFEPNQLKVSEANGKEISIICESPLSNDTVISLLDKDDEEIGKLNVFKNDNHKQLHFNITPVRILRGNSQDKDKEAIEDMIDSSHGFGDKSKDLNGDLQNLQEYLNNQSLNQALLQCSIGKVHDVIINEDEWIKDDLIVEESCVFKGEEVLEKFDKEFKKQHPIEAKKRGLVLFLSPLKKEEVGGEGEISEIDAKRLVIYQSNLGDKKSFVHEVSHVLGLTHSFEEKSTDEDVFKMNTFIKQVDDSMNSMIANNVPKDEIVVKWNTYKENYKNCRSYLNTYYRNPYFFEKTKTENIMDYDNNKTSFWKYQWNAMQDDIIKFYSVK